MVRYIYSAWQDAQPEPDSVDLVICDPFYEEKNLTYLWSMDSALRPGGSLYVFSDHSGVARTKVFLDGMLTLQFQNWLIWGPNDWGGRSQKRWGQKHDDILFYTKRGAPHYFDGDAVAVPKKMTQQVFNPSGRQTKIPHSVWDDLAGFSTLSSERVKLHGKAAPWQKPERVIERIIQASSKPGDFVYDPFGGVATVPAVCNRLGRDCLSTEMNSDIYAAGCSRLGIS